jgi:hypothetical protein
MEFTQLNYYVLILAWVLLSEFQYSPVNLIKVCCVRWQYTYCYQYIMWFINCYSAANSNAAWLKAVPAQHSLLWVQTPENSSSHTYVVSVYLWVCVLVFRYCYRCSKHCARKWIFLALIKLPYESCCLIARPVHASVPEELLLYCEDGNGLFVLHVVTCWPNYKVSHSSRQ